MSTLQSGDIFLLNSGGWLHDTINFFQTLYSGDRKSDYIHAGIILNSDGLTFETSKWRTGNLNLFTKYPASLLLIARWKGMTAAKAAQGYLAVYDQMDKIYPYHRLFLFIIRLARWIHWNGMACSELASKFLNFADDSSRRWWGVNVDDLHDEIKKDPAKWTVVFEGQMPLPEGERDG